MNDNTAKLKNKIRCAADMADMIRENVEETANELGAESEICVRLMEDASALAALKRHLDGIGEEVPV